MSWLESAGEHSGRSGGTSSGVSSEDGPQGWLRQRLCIERGLDSGDLVIEAGSDGVWVHAWVSREDLVWASRTDVDELDIVEMQGSDLREWLRARDRVEVGVLLHPNHIDEHVVLRPQAQPVQRVALEY